MRITIQMELKLTKTYKHLDTRITIVWLEDNIHFVVGH